MNKKRGEVESRGLRISIVVLVVLAVALLVTILINSFSSSSGDFSISSLTGALGVAIQDEEGQPIKTGDTVTTLAECVAWPCACGDNITASIDMTSSLNDCSNSGLVIGARNITINCRGYTIDGAGGGTQAGIWNAHYKNITIKNCVIRQFTNGIQFTNSTNVTIRNNTIYGNIDRGIHFLRTNRSLIVNNRIENTSTGISDGIYLQDSGNNVTVRDNAIENNGRYGIYIDGKSPSMILNNTIIDNNNTGIYFDNTGTDKYISIRIINNTLQRNFHPTMGTTISGIYIQNANHTLIQGNKIYANHSYKGIQMLTVGNMTIFDNVINWTQVGIYVQTLSNKLNFSQNKINYSTYSTGQEGAIRIDQTFSTPNTNVTIEDNIINYGGTIDLRQIKWLRFINNTVYNSTVDGVQISQSDNVTIDRNKVTYFGTRGIDLTAVNITAITRNNVSHGISDGILTDSGSRMVNGNISTNEIKNLSDPTCSGISCGSATHTGLEIYNINLSEVSRNIFERTKTGLSLNLGYNNSIFNNTISYSSSIGIVVFSMTNNSYIQNTILHPGVNKSYGEEDMGFNIYSSGKNKFKKNIIKNFTNCIRFFEGSNGNQFEDNEYTDCSRAYYFRAGSNNNFTRDKILNNTMGISADSSEFVMKNNRWYDSNFTLNNIDVNVTAGGSSIYFLNTTDNNKSSVSSSSSRFVVQWYVTVNVSNSGFGGGGVQNAVATSKDVLGAIESKINTSGNGLAKVIATEFYKQNNIKYFTTVNHTFKVFRRGFYQNSSSLDVRRVNETHPYMVNISIGTVSCGDVLLTNFTLSADMTAFGSIDCLKIGSNNIVVNGDNYELNNFAIGKSGINITNKTNIKVENLTIRLYSRGIYLANSSNSTFDNIKIINTSNAIIFNSSKNNIMRDSTIINNSNHQVYSAHSNIVNNYLVNMTMHKLNLTAAGSSNLFLQWYVTVNSTYGNGIQGGLKLQSANSTGFFNSSKLFEHSKQTDRNGFAILELSELKANKSGRFNMSPHNITLTFSSSSGTGTNFTYVNLFKINNTQVNMSLFLTCTAPTLGGNLSGNLTLCPGTFTAHSIFIDRPGTNITCDRTILEGDETNIGINITAENVTIRKCKFKKQGIAIKVDNANGFNLTYLNMTTCKTLGGGGSASAFADFGENFGQVSVIADAGCIILSSSSYGKVRHSKFGGGDFGVWLNGSSHNVINNITITLSEVAMSLLQAKNNTIVNSTFLDSTRGISTENPQTTRNVFYHNNVSGMSALNIYSDNASVIVDNFNNTVGSFIQGNEWDDYCDKGKDNDGDGYADADNSGNDWPYDNIVSAKVAINDFKGGYIADYHPKVRTCPAGDVFLGAASTADSVGSSKAAASGAAAPAAAAAPPAPPSAATSGSAPPPPPSVTDISNALSFGIGSIQDLGDGTAVGELSLRYDGEGNPLVNFEVGDTKQFFIVTGKTLGLPIEVFGITYGQEPPNVGPIVASVEAPNVELKKGEELKIPFKAKASALSANRFQEIPIVVKLVTGEVIKEGTITIETPVKVGSAIDVDTDNNLVNIYLVVAEQSTADPEQKKNNNGESSDIGNKQKNPKSTDNLPIDVNKPSIQESVDSSSNVNVEINNVDQEILDKNNIPEKSPGGNFDGAAIADLGLNNKTPLSSSITGAVVGLRQKEFDEYTFEVTINDINECAANTILPLKFSLIPIDEHYELRFLFTPNCFGKNLFSEIYGPYRVKKGQGVVLAQQLIYDETVFGDVTVSTKLLKNGEVVVTNNFEKEFK